MIERSCAGERQCVVARIAGFREACGDVIYRTLGGSVVFGFVARDTRWIERSKGSIELIRVARFARDLEMRAR